MKITVHVEGLKQLDVALGLLPKTAGRTVLKRTLAKAAEPIRAAAEAMAPRDTGELAGSIIVSTKVKNTAGNAEYAAAMASGLGKAAASAALRGARRAAKGAAPFVTLYVGPRQAKSKKNAVKRIVQEFGSADQRAQPYMRPAWDANKDKALTIVRHDLGNEIIAAAKRLARNRRVSDAVKYSAATAALLAHEGLE